MLWTELKQFFNENDIIQNITLDQQEFTFNCNSLAAEKFLQDILKENFGIKKYRIKRGVVI